MINEYLETVRPLHKQFIEPTKHHADVILPDGANGPAADMTITKVATLIRVLDWAWCSFFGSYLSRLH